MESLIKETGKVKSNMVMEYKYGKMELSMRENGRIIKLMVKEHLNILTEINL